MKWVLIAFMSYSTGQAEVAPTVFYDSLQDCAQAQTVWEQRASNHRFVVDHYATCVTTSEAAETIEKIKREKTRVR